MVCALCVSTLLWQNVTRLSFSDADGGHKFITPWGRQPIILNAATLCSCTLHIWRHVCYSSVWAACVCSSVCTPQSGVWVSKLVKVKQIGGVSWLLFKSSCNRSCQEYWLTAFIADSSCWNAIDIKCKTSIPVKEPMIVCLHSSHSQSCCSSDYELFVSSHFFASLLMIHNLQRYHLNDLSSSAQWSFSIVTQHGRDKWQPLECEPFTCTLVWASHPVTALCTHQNDLITSQNL